MILYVVSSRYGIQINEPEHFRNENVAIDYIKQSVVDAMIENDEEASTYYDEHSVDETLAWGDEHDLCASYNSIIDENGNTIMDTCTIGDEWYEYMLTKLDTDDIND